MKFKKASIITKIIIAALILYAGVTLVTLKGRVTAAREEQADLQAQVDEATAANAELEYQIKHSDEDDIIEDIARSKLGLVMPGEKIFYDIGNC